MLIRTKLYGQIQPVVEIREHASGKVGGSGGLYYDLFTIISPTRDLIFYKVYQGEIKSNPKLMQTRKTREGWDNLIDKVAEGEL